MQALYRIWTIARYEMKTLARSWFFRIFAIIALLLILLIDYLFFISGNLPWTLRCLPASMPYMSTMLVNMAQAVVVIFIASEFLKLDRKLNSTETIYARSMTNYEYVFGKTMGVFLLFFGVNLLVLAGALIMHIFFSEIPIDWISYIAYPVIIGAPTLLYILGLSFFAMSVFQNQAVTFIILLAYIAGTLFYFGNKFYYLFDYMAFNLPLMSSDFVGFAGLTPIMLHRGIYFAVGFACICATALMLKRLPQSRMGNRVITLFMLAAFIWSGYAGVKIIGDISGGITLRNDINNLNRSLAEVPQIAVTTCDLDVIHNGSTIAADAALMVKNPTDEPLDTFLFNLNPGFTVTGASIAGTAAESSRELHMITLSPAAPLAPGDSVRVTISYEGAFNPEACYSDVDEEERATVNNFVLYKIAKRYGFITPDYVLLTPECGWYPAAGVPVGSVFPNTGGTAFTRFSLNVTTTPGLSVVAQGGIAEAADGTVSLSPELPMVGLSMAIGEYEVKSMTVDDIEYMVVIKHGHDYFSEQFTSVTEDIPDLIREFREQAEGENLMVYPYPRFTLVETPVQFYAYDRPWRTHLATVQPEMMLLPEKGFYLTSADFNETMRFGGRGRGMDMSDEERMLMMFRRFVMDTLMSDTRARAQGQRMRSGPGGGGFSLGAIFGVLMPSYTPSFTLAPNAYGFITGITSDTYPVFNTVAEFYSKFGLAPSGPDFMRMFGGAEGMSTDELACLELDNRSFEALVHDPPEKDVLNSALQLKGFALFGAFAERAGTDAFDDFFAQYIQAHRFTTVSLEDFCEELSSAFAIDCTPIIDPWYRSSGLAEFAFTDMSLTEMIEGEHTVYQLSAIITNTRPVPGIVQIESSAFGGRGGFGGFGGGMTTETRFFSFEGDQSKEIGIVYSFQPNRVVFNTIVARNLPLQFNQMFENVEVDEENEPFDGERILDQAPPLTEPGETIVDNEDPGFEIVSQPEVSTLQTFFRGDEDSEEYIGFNPFRPPDTWSGTINDQLYGLRKTGVYKVAGNGDLAIRWTARLEESGRYDVYCHSPNLMNMGGPGGRRGRNMDFMKEMNYLVYHDDGVDEITVDPETAEEGWVYIGSFYLSAGDAVVELTDDTSGRMVYGDAIKWVKK